MTELKPIGKAVANVTGPKLRMIHAILHSMQAKELLALKAKSRFSKEETAPYFGAIAAEIKKRNEIPDQVLQLDVFLALAKLMKLPAARLNEREKVTARSAEIENKWFERRAKKNKAVEAQFEASFISSKLEFMLHYEYVQLFERFLKNEKAEEGKESLQANIRRYWEELPDFKKVQIFEHLHIHRSASFEEIKQGIGLETLVFEMGIRSGLFMYGEILSPIQKEVPPGFPKEMWILHPDALFTTEAALKTLFSGSWLLPAAMLILYTPDESAQANDESILSSEWVTRESAYLLLFRQINELKLEQQKEEKHILHIQQELALAESSEKRAEAVYQNLRERLIVLLKTDAARPFLGDVSISNTRLREKLIRVTEKIDTNREKRGVLSAAGAWLSNTYWHTEKNTLEKKLQASYEKMADEVMEKYPYYEADLIAELTAARATANGWQFESSRLRKAEAEASKSLADLKNEELKLREKAAEAAAKTPGLKQLDAGDMLSGSSIT
ncbi:hypothetical protein L2D08_06755 [Domibacillus sp. PGB-M46]|uniref:hypothetical protein n=1 Tax=Domibacillus sp. PGB-M46 TaxID=2910255 RepID=UPI001F573C19|nr:hypothetical protein [Domibacillus sp. PGB-M46]MCI2254062.1 hypothetical protein [Domibacillus sp. PGB-M46]